MSNLKTIISAIAAALALTTAPAYALTDDHGEIHKASELQEIAAASQQSAAQGRKASGVRAAEGTAGKQAAANSKASDYDSYDFQAVKVSAP